MKEPTLHNKLQTMEAFRELNPQGGTIDSAINNYIEGGEGQGGAKSALEITDGKGFGIVQW